MTPGTPAGIRKGRETRKESGSPGRSDLCERRRTAVKKWICLLLALLLCGVESMALGGGLASLWVTASPTPEATPQVTPGISAAGTGGGFSFRGGVRWGMTRDLVKALETVELVGRENGEWSILYPTVKVDVSRYQADLTYMFLNDQLKMIAYNFGAAGTEADFQYLTGALDSVYGDHVEPDAAMIFGFWNQIYPGSYSLENIRQARGWTAGEDTMICLYYYAKDAYEILYIRAGKASDAYVTTGL